MTISIKRYYRLSKTLFGCNAASLGRAVNKTRLVIYAYALRFFFSFSFPRRYRETFAGIASRAFVPRPTNNNVNGERCFALSRRYTSRFAWPAARTFLRRCYHTVSRELTAACGTAMHHIDQFINAKCVSAATAGASIPAHLRDALR